MNLWKKPKVLRICRWRSITVSLFQSH